MPQFGLLAIPLFIIINLLSGGNTPLDSMPEWLQTRCRSRRRPTSRPSPRPSLFRGASLAMVWQELAAFAVIGAAFFGGALLRFRRAITSYQ